MNRSRDPALMSPEERLAEIASLLAIACRRLQLVSETQAETGPQPRTTSREDHDDADDDLPF